MKHTILNQLIVYFDYQKKIINQNIFIYFRYISTKPEHTKNAVYFNKFSLPEKYKKLRCLESLVRLIHFFTTCFKYIKQIIYVKKQCFMNHFS